MPIWNGGIIGVANDPTSSVASGVWSLQEQELAKKAGAWPNNDPTLALDFNETTTLDSRITFTRATNGTYFDSSGVLQTASSGAARFDHRLESGVWVNKGLLIEEQRTNLILRSEEFDNAAWTKTNATVTANATTSPDGTTNADALFETTTNGAHLVRTTSFITTGAATTYSFSVFVKSNGRSIFSLQMNSVGGNITAEFDLSAVTATALSPGGTGVIDGATIEDVENGWYRCTIIGRTAQTLTNYYIYIQDVSGNYSYVGDVTKGFYLWGAQLEAGAFATSYIKTTTASVTRNADVVVMTGTSFSSWYNQSEGTVFLQVDRLAPIDSGFPTILSINNGTGNERFIFNYNSDPDYRFIGVDGNVGQFTLEQLTSISAGTVGKLCGAYKVNDFAFSADGNSVLTDTSGTLPTPSQANLGANYLGLSQVNGHIAKFYYWNTRKSNSFLQNITS
jgi:hypothetical protein